MTNVLNDTTCGRLAAAISCDRCGRTLAVLPWPVPGPAWLSHEVRQLRVASRRCGWRRRPVIDADTGLPVIADLCPTCRRKETSI
jgi:hypothetical protein